MPAFDGNRHLLDLALNRTRLSESHEACLRDADSTVGLVPIRRANLRNAEGIPVAPSLELWEALFLGLERFDCSRRVHQALLKCLRRRFLQPQHVVFLFPQHQPSGQLRVLEKRNLLFKAPLLQFYRLVPHETPTPGSLSEDSLLLPGRHQFELVGDVGFRDLNPTPSFSRTHASHEFARRGFERLSSRRLKPRVFSARLYKIPNIGQRKARPQPLSTTAIDFFIHPCTVAPKSAPPSSPSCFSSQATEHQAFRNI